MIPGGVTLEFADRMAAEYGEDSGVYRARVAGEATLLFATQDPREFGFRARELPTILAV